MADLPFTIFIKIKSFSVYIHSLFFLTKDGIIFLYKPISNFTRVFPLNPYSQAEEAKLHMLDVKRALAFYLDRSKESRQSPNLVIMFEKKNKEKTVSMQTLL